MRYVFDLDGTLCETAGQDYGAAVPMEARIERVNELHREGHHITVHTARGSGTGEDWRERTRAQLATWGLCYDVLRVGEKPPADLYVDDRAVRADVFFGPGLVIWLTGQPGSGKTTLARQLRQRGAVEFVVDGDQLRALREEGYDERGRHANVARAQDVAQYLAGEGRRVAVALVSPYRAQREAFKARTPTLEVYLHTTERRGREHYFADPYEAPGGDALHLDTGELSVDECLQRIEQAARTVHRTVPALSQGPRVAPPAKAG